MKCSACGRPCAAIDEHGYTCCDYAAAPKRIGELHEALRWLLKLVEHETDLPDGAANGVGHEIGAMDEGVMRAAEIIAEARAALGEHKLPKENNNE